MGQPQMTDVGGKSGLHYTKRVSRERRCHERRGYSDSPLALDNRWIVAAAISTLTQSQRLLTRYRHRNLEQILLIRQFHFSAS